MGYDRREFIELSAASLGSVLLGQEIPTLDQQEPAEDELSTPPVPVFLDTEPQKIAFLEQRTRSLLSQGVSLPSTVFDIFGIHDSPILGNHPNLNKQMSDLKRWGVKSLKSLMPEAKTYEAYQARDVNIVARGYFKANRFVEEPITKIVQDLVYWYPGQTTYFQPFNEVNLPGRETGGPFRSPEDHVKKDLMPAAKKVAEVGEGQVKTIVTPIAPLAEIDGYTTDSYQLELYHWISKEESPDWIRKNLVIGDNPYIFSPNEDPFWRLQKTIFNIYDSLHQFLPLIACEGGLHQQRPDRVYTHEIAAAEAVRILGSTIPLHLRPLLLGYFFWIYDRGNNLPESDYSLCAWIGDKGDNAEAREVAKYASVLNQRGF